MQTVSAPFTEHKVGDLVWIPAGSELIFSSTVNDGSPPWRATYKKVPVYGLIIETKPAMARVLVGEEQFHVHYRDIYGEKNDY